MTTHNTTILDNTAEVANYEAQIQALNQEILNYKNEIHNS
jgi:hypothetical protein